jgi:hypothetical protein
LFFSAISGVDRERRIEAARKSHAVIAAYDKVDDPEHRTVAVSRQIDDVIDDICEGHKAEGGACFSDSQVECLKEIAFHIAFILDPRNKTPSTTWGRIRAEMKTASWTANILFWAAVVGAIAALAQTVDLGVKGIGQAWEWYRPSQAATVAPQDVAPGNPAPAQRTPSMIPSGPSQYPPPR